MFSKIKFILLVFGICMSTLLSHAQEVKPTLPDTTKTATEEVIDLEAMLRKYAVEMNDSLETTEIDTNALDTLPNDTVKVGKNRVFVIDRENILNIEKVLQSIDFLPIDDIYLRTNPLFIDLVLNIKRLHEIDLAPAIAPYNINFKNKNEGLHALKKPVKLEEKTALILSELRDHAARKILVSAPQLYKYKNGQLADLSVIKNVERERSISRINFADDLSLAKPSNKISLAEIKKQYWTKKAVSELQFSQHYISENWHKGGNDYIAILGTLSGQINYDNRENVQWENKAEWRAGFNSIEGDTIRKLSTNDDVFRLSSKLGIKASGSFFYSASFDFNTNFFPNYSGVNSMKMKANFLTPVRMNIGLGMDYKYKKMFSVMVSPLSYRFVYANDTANIPIKSFGILPGENTLHDLGSSLRVQFSHQFSPEIQVESKMFFYTNYTKVEFDWEIVGNFRVNRFLTTKVLINPRYDNTVILPNSDKAKWQFKEMITFGLSYRLIN